MRRYAVCSLFFLRGETAIVRSMEKKYRKAVSALVLRPVEVCEPGGVCKTVYELLLLHKPRVHDAWQLPQGGVETGETAEQAAVREVEEEAGLRLSRTVLTSCHTYTYDFPSEFVARYHPVNSGQTLCFAVFLAPADAAIRVDGKEVDGYLWILPHQLSHYVHRKQYLDVIRNVFAECAQAGYQVV